MNNYASNPVYFRLDILSRMEVSEVDELARFAAGTLTSYRLVLGRCLLAMRQSKGYKKFGCSSEIHYAVSRLGLSDAVAGECRRVARDLIPLPQLTLAAENGIIGWGKLREISRKASPETETLWLKLAEKMNYKPIEALVRKTPRGGLPGDVFEEPESPVTELRCNLSEQVWAMLDRARRMYSLEKNEAVTTAEVLEWALVSYISNQPVDEEVHARVQEDMDRDLQAQKAREIPLVEEAREMAAEMGYIPVPRLEENEDDFPRAGENLQKEECVLAQALGGAPLIELAEVQLENAPAEPQSESTLPNPRLRFNPMNRHATKAQKKAILRREGWCCRTPGCPHRIWLHLHHLVPYSQGGPTHEKNLAGLCVACHCNHHDGHMRIFQDSSGRLVFTDADGNCLTEQADIELARWLDWNMGWKGEETDSRSHRTHAGDWSVFERG